MFICEDCLAKHYENTPNALTLKSYGSCEYCKKTKVCYDIYSGNLRPKKVVANPMRIKSKSIDLDYFEQEIEKFMGENNIQKEDVINITVEGDFTTLWYWEKII